MGACAVTKAREVTHEAPAELGSQGQQLTVAGGPWEECSRKGHSMSQGLVAGGSSQEWPEGREQERHGWGVGGGFLRARAPRSWDPARKH